MERRLFIAVNSKRLQFTIFLKPVNLAVCLMNMPSLDFNIAAHDRVAQKYESLHLEIYNQVEQNRLSAAVNDAVLLLPASAARPLVLDFGCGAGNLTRKFINSGCDVIASDVSTEFLKLVSSIPCKTSVTTLQLNGIDLREIASDSIDIVATYSVLHHVPDYLLIVEEFARVVKPGGIVFIDHEKTEGYWANISKYHAAYKDMVPLARRLTKFLRLENYRTWIKRKFIDARYSPEGDIHVYPDDHIEWTEVDRILTNKGFALYRTEEYMLFRGDYSPEKYNIYSEHLKDMRLLIAQKKLN